MNSYILLLTFSTLGLYNGPKSFQISEFQTSVACEIALNEAKKFYRTVEEESRCISVAKEVEKQKLMKEIASLKEKEK